MTSFFQRMILAFLTVLILSACGGGSSGGSPNDNGSGGNSENESSNNEDSSDTEQVEAFSLNIDPTAINEPLGTFHSNTLNIGGRLTGDQSIGFVRILILDDLDIFGDDVVALQGRDQDFLSIRLPPKDDLRRDTYEGSLAITLCTNSSCAEILGENQYFVDYTINYIPERWMFDVQNHPQLNAQGLNTFFRNLTLSFNSQVGQVIEPIEVLVDWPEGFTGFTLPQDMIEELQVFDITDNSFFFRLNNTTLGTYTYNYTITLNSDEEDQELTFSADHAIVPEGFDALRAQLLTGDLEFSVESQFSDKPDTQTVRVYKPADESLFSAIKFEYSDCRWLSIETESIFGIEEQGFSDAEVEVQPFLLTSENESCLVDVQFKGESIGTFTVNVSMQN